MGFRARVLHVANIFRIPVITGGVVLTAFLAFSAAPAHAACTVGGGAAIDGFAVGASVNCPTGTVQAGTVPPDGATITNKNVAGGSTTFTYTSPGVGTVQLAGTVNLTAATATGSPAVNATTENTTANVVALFGGGNGGPTISDVPVDSGTALGPAAPDPRDVLAFNRAQTLLTSLEERKEALDAELGVARAAVPALISDKTLNQGNQAKIEKLKNELEALEEAQTVATLNEQGDAELTPGERVRLRTAGQVLIEKKKDEIAAAEAKAAEDIRDRLIALGNMESEIEKKEAELLGVNAQISRTESRINNLQNDLRSGRGGSIGTTNPFTSLFKYRRSGNRPNGALGAFTTSFRLSQLLLQVRDKRLGQTETNEPLFRRPPELPSALDMFAKVSYSDVENDANGAGYESKSWQGTVGLDYRLTRAWALGAFTAFTSNTSKTGTINSNSESFSYLVGPFVRFNATQNITLSASLSAGSTNTDLNVAGATSSFDSNQRLATFGVRGSWAEGNWTFAPAGGISYRLPAATASPTATATSTIPAPTAPARSILARRSAISTPCSTPARSPRSPPRWASTGHTTTNTAAT
tara:strand:+ start:19857 stop:21608 length:1752 start_codon:yes stop_codon:yes gene_type:complete